MLNLLSILQFNSSVTSAVGHKSLSIQHHHYKNRRINLYYCCPIPLNKPMFKPRTEEEEEAAKRGGDWGSLSYTSYETKIHHDKQNLCWQSQGSRFFPTHNKNSSTTSSSTDSDRYNIHIKPSSFPVSMVQAVVFFPHTIKTVALVVQTVTDIYIYINYYIQHKPSSFPVSVVQAVVIFPHAHTQ